jgi:hypothetical protein
VMCGRAADRETGTHRNGAAATPPTYRTWARSSSQEVTPLQQPGGNSAAWYAREGVSRLDRRG